MRNHMMMMHSGEKIPQGGGSLTNCLEVKPTVVPYTLLCTRLGWTRILCTSVLFIFCKLHCTRVAFTRIICISVLCTRILCTRVVWMQESRLGEMGIGGGRRLKNALASPPGTIMHPPKLEQCNLKAAVQQWNDLECTGCQIVCIGDQWFGTMQWCIMHCSAEKCNTFSCNAVFVR